MLIEQYLLYLAAPPHRIGFDQLICALEYLLRHPQATQLYAEVYPAVAAAFDTTESCVDHNLRKVIAYIWDYGNREHLIALGCGSFRPSNKIFLFALSRRLRLMEESPELFPLELIGSDIVRSAAADSRARVHAAAQNP